MGAKAIELELETLEGSGGYAREMTEDRAARQRELLTPYIAAADALITTAAVPGRPAPMLVTRRMVEADEARLRRRRPGRRERRQRRGLGGRRGGADRQRAGLGRPQRAEPDARPGVPALRPERRQPGHPDDRHGRRRQPAFAPDFDDEIVSGSCVTQGGRIVHEPTREAIEGPAAESRLETAETVEPTSRLRRRATRRTRRRAARSPLRPGGRPVTLDTGVVWLTIFVLSVFVGIEVISKVSSTLHTPLMSGANAIHGIILLGAILVTGTHRQQPRARRRAGRDRAGVGQHGRRVRGHRPDAADVRPQEARAQEGRADGWGRLMPTWAQLAYLACGVCFILALKGLSARRPRATATCSARRRAVVACVMPFFWPDLHLQHVPLILVAIAIGTAIGVFGARTRADDPDAAAGGAVQRRRWWCRGAGRAARAARRRSRRVPTRAGSTWSRRRFTILVGSVSFAGSMVTFAKLQELMTTRPVVFPGLPVVFGGSLVAALLLAVLLVDDPRMWVGILLALVGLLLGVLLVLPVGGADVPIVISLLNAFTGLTVAAGGYVLGNVLLLVARHPGRRLRHVPHPADGQRDGPVGRRTSCSARSRAARRSAPARPPTARCAASTPRTSRSCWRTPTG